MTSSTSAEHRNLIIDHWFRLLFDSKMSIQDIAKLIVEFGDQCEGFIACTNRNKIEISEDLLTVSFDGKDDTLRYICVCGKVDAFKGAEYHWKIKLSAKGDYINVGVVEHEFCEKILNDLYINKHFWATKLGWSWYSGDGHIWHNNHEKIYQQGYDVTDTVDIWLDLKNNSQLSFGINGEKFVKAYDMNEHKSYRMAIGVYRTAQTKNKFELII